MQINENSIQSKYMPQRKNEVQYNCEYMRVFSNFVKTLVRNIRNEGVLLFSMKKMFINCLARQILYKTLVIKYKNSKTVKT